MYTNIPDHGVGHGPNIVLEMVRTEMEKGHHVVRDDYFGFISQLKELSHKNISCTSTLREVLRGSCEEAFIGCESVVKWKDNKVVGVRSNRIRAEPLQKAKRYDRIKKKNTPMLMLQIP